YCMLTRVWRAAGYMDAQIVKSYLESFGLEVFTFEESVGLTFGLTATPLGEVEIFVRDEDEEKALKYLEEYQSAQDGD
ncbi:MAG: DUF2007 domain-containing protein, partial [Chloroflexi bacterium]|nr:DUF2007 domain-containing protein [Chloroflexota bacterium]